MDLKKAGISKAINTRDTATIFDWLLTAFSYQGISDQVARSYMARNGRASWGSISAELAKRPSCPRLQGYRHYSDCRYDKGSFSCAEPEHIDCCPVPRPKLRNGRLNQTAYSFFLFTRDIANDDLVGWIDDRLSPPGILDLHEAADPQERLLGPLRNVYGVSDKILTMTLSGLLLGAASRPHWFDAGAGMIAIDTLVHNFLHRTGIAQSCGKPHQYGINCYRHGGCADLVRRISAEIDATEFNRTYPLHFPRFVQHAIWRFCAADGLNVCNGNQIDDSKRCLNTFCQIGQLCARAGLKSQ